MKESTLRWVGFVTGIAAFALLAVHLIWVMVPPGNFGANLSYGAVTGSFDNDGYVLVLGALLVVALAHAFLGVRRTLLDVNVGPRGLAALAGVAVVTTSVLLYLFVTTIG